MADTKNTATENTSHRKANIAVIIIASVAALILIAIAVLCIVKVDPKKDIARPHHYDLYNVGETAVMSTVPQAQDRIDDALGDMKYSVMSAMLQGRWDYGFSFKYNNDGDRMEFTGEDIENITSTDSEFMIVLVFEPAKIAGEAIGLDSAQSIVVQGETIYFDTLKILIGDSDGGVDNISLYPYLSQRLKNESDIEGIASDTYKTVGINVLANTTTAFRALTDLAYDIKTGNFED